MHASEILAIGITIIAIVIITNISYYYYYFMSFLGSPGSRGGRLTARVSIPTAGQLQSA